MANPERVETRRVTREMEAEVKRLRAIVLEVVVRLAWQTGSRCEVSILCTPISETEAKYYARVRPAGGKYVEITVPADDGEFRNLLEQTIVSLYQ